MVAQVILLTLHGFLTSSPLAAPHRSLTAKTNDRWLALRVEEPFSLTPSTSSHHFHDFLPHKSGVQSQATANICYISQHVHKPGNTQRIGLMLVIASMWCNKREYQNQKCSPVQQTLSWYWGAQYGLFLSHTTKFNFLHYCIYSFAVK